MNRNFNDDISTPDKFVVTLELVPGRDVHGTAIDQLVGISRDAYDDGRITAVSITDNPGGNPALSPDALGSELLEYGLDVIVHFTCRDTNRVGMESRALQLARMGMKNILALTGDYSGTGFGGRGTPVFDFDSVVLTSMLNDLNRRFLRTSHTDIFVTGCAVSPFKYTEAETWVQYRKLQLKRDAGATFAITQLGYDIDKYEELLLHNRENGIEMPVLASLYHLTKGAAGVMHKGRVPGVYVPRQLYKNIVEEYEVQKNGPAAAEERTARLGAILKGIGYNGIHLGGIHKSFDTVGRILDRIEEIGDDWRQYVEDFKVREPKDFYLYGNKEKEQQPKPSKEELKIRFTEDFHYVFLRTAHDLFFDKSASLAPFYKKISTSLDKNNVSWMLKSFLEDPFKKLLLSCQGCGDCGIQHVGFLCPESGCPKHTRNGACGGSRHGYCEVNTDKYCVWVRAFYRMKKHNEDEKLSAEFVPPRLWELKNTSSWINFHLDRDHQRNQKAA
ncbi:methylenetetrahydrofolate reductase C-terminal domain-containing protein [Desulfopila sp. IMCC35008]|uniref:methylenetetrahydrofolate reductase C-terminal domain-containing protein n=1 Tax=Desulfopila sp. IMCC35008 TaxID=2653858 RepID=UPI0013D845C6|nr:methylenetetrahydrofolate reductase C-terminal domain-containing protein [Desulfopila sp. IMCC35008]